MKFEFRWSEWNLEHATRHGVSIAEIEQVANAQRHSYRHQGDGKYLAEGRGKGDRFVRVVFLIDPDGTIYVIHTMPLTTRRRR